MFQKSPLFAAALAISYALVFSSGTFAQESADASPPRKPLKMVELDFGGEDKPVESTRTASWFLGKKLSLVLVMKARGAEEESFANRLSESRVFAAALDIELPEFPEISAIKDIWAARDYLLKKGEGSVRDLVLAEHGEDCAAIFGLASVSILTGTLYSPELGDPDTPGIQKDINQKLVDQFKICVMGSEFHNQQEAVKAVVPVIGWMENLKPEGQDFAKEIIALSKKFEALLFSESDSAAPPAVPTEPDAEPDTEPAPKTAEAEEAEEMLAKFTSPDADLRALTAALLPTAEATEKLFVGELAGRSAKVYSKLFSDSQMVIVPGDRTEIIVKSITTDELKAASDKAREFPGGYKEIAARLRPGITIYQFSFVRPGEERGIRFDGLVKIDGNWYLFPKVWRLLDEQPFGIEVE